MLAGEQVPEVMASLKVKLEALESFDAPSIKAAIKAVQKETGHKGRNLFMPIRVVTTGQTSGPELPAAIALIGKENSNCRIAKYAGNKNRIELSVAQNSALALLSEKEYYEILIVTRFS